jgi:hypothetical protein
MKIDEAFPIGSCVYIKTDSDQKERLITGIQVRPIGLIYIAALEGTESFHYEMELSDEKNVLISLT